jgi:hypothetical protein
MDEFGEGLVVVGSEPEDAHRQVACAVGHDRIDYIVAAL